MLSYLDVLSDLRIPLETCSDLAAKALFLMLSYFAEGPKGDREAMDWKHCFLAGKFDEAQRNRTTVSYGRFNNFLQKFTEDFALRLGHNHARKDLKNIQQEGNVKSHNTAFKNLMIMAGYAFPHTDADNNLESMEDFLIGIYQDSLKKPILDRIRNNGFNPYTLKDWMD